MWSDFFWAFLVIVLVIFISTIIEAWVEHHKNKPEEELCDFDYWLMDQTIEFVLQSDDFYRGVKKECKNEIILYHAGRIAKDRLMQAGVKITKEIDAKVDAYIMDYLMKKSQINAQSASEE